MVASVLLTGSTGYLGGCTLNLLIKTFPDLHYTALVRTEEQAGAIRAVHANIKTVVGDLSAASSATVEAAAAAADIVIDTAGDNADGVKAILAGLSAHNGARKTAGTLIHVSGVTCLIDMANLNLGKPAPRIYSDRGDYAELMSLPVDREHLAIDWEVLAAQEQLGVKSIILSSCQIMGNGNGPWKKETYGHWYVKTVLGRGKGFTVEQGENVWSWCSVSDVASAIVFTLGKVLEQEPTLKYGKDGYYFVQTGESSFREQAQVIASRLKELGKLSSDDVDALTVAQASEIHPYAGLLWGASCRSRADRLKELGWTPQQQDWKPLMLETVAMAVSS